jgi:hypothetical protein
VLDIEQDVLRRIARESADLRIIDRQAPVGHRVSPDPVGIPIARDWHGHPQEGGQVGWEAESEALFDADQLTG